MIITEKSWLSLVFAVRGSTVINIWPRVVFVLILSIGVEMVSKAGTFTFSLTPVPFTVVGLALAIFLGFRNNAAYDRYWEGRKLWGGLVNVTRNFAMQTRLIRKKDSEVSEPDSELVRLILGYVNSLRHRLRSSSAESDLRTYLNDEQVEHVLSQDNTPLAILDLATQRLIREWREGNIETYQLTSLQKDLSKMLDVQGGCERIHSTPVPFTYSVLTHRTVTLYCFALPFGLHDSIGWAMPVVTTFIAYAFLGLDDLGDELEQPFGQQPNSLPLHGICRTIEINLLELLGTPSDQVPKPIQAVDDILG